MNRRWRIFWQAFWEGFTLQWIPFYGYTPWSDVKRKGQWIEGFSGKPLTETDEWKLFRIVGLHDTCPDCHGSGFYEGPSGGMSTNIFCMNRDCRSGFNITWFDQRNGMCERIGKGDLERYPK